MNENETVNTPNTEAVSSVETDTPETAKKPFSGNTKFILSITLKLLFISAITACLLAGVNALTKHQIAANTAAERAAAITAIFPTADSNALTDVTGDGVTGVYLVYADGSLIGYAAQTAPSGFGGTLDVMVGVNPDATVAGIEIVSHSETPGLGSRVDNADYLKQYQGLSGCLSIGTDVEAITGSTISSKAVLSAVNAALAVTAYIDVPSGGVQ